MPQQAGGSGLLSCGQKCHSSWEASVFWYQKRCTAPVVSKFCGHGTERKRTRSPLSAQVLVCLYGSNGGL